MSTPTLTLNYDSLTPGTIEFAFAVARDFAPVRPAPPAEQKRSDRTANSRHRTQSASGSGIIDLTGDQSDEESDEVIVVTAKSRPGLASRDINSAAASSTSKPVALASGNAAQGPAIPANDNALPLAHTKADTTKWSDANSEATEARASAGQVPRVVPEDDVTFSEEVDQLDPDSEVD